MSISLSSCVPMPLDDCPSFISDFINMGEEVGKSYNQDSSSLLNEVSWRIRRLLSYHMVTNQPFFWLSNTPFGGMIIGYKIEDGEEKVTTFDMPPIQNLMALEVFKTLVKNENGIYDEDLNKMLMYNPAEAEDFNN